MSITQIMHLALSVVTLRMICLYSGRTTARDARHEGVSRRKKQIYVCEPYLTEQKKSSITFKACEVYLEAAIARTAPLQFTTRPALLKTDKFQ